MKKLLILSTFAVFFSAVGFAGGDQDKGKDKKKTDSTKTKTMAKPCPGKECSKKKG
jgi:hypothetical protein